MKRNDGQAPRNTVGVSRLMAISGIVAPFFYAALIITLGLLEPGYSHQTRMMSILGGVGGPRGFIFNVGVGLTGLLLIAFAIGLQRSIGRGKGSRVGPLLIVLGAAGMIGSAVFHCDLDCANVLSRTPIGVVHMLTAFVAGFSLAMSPFFVFVRLRKDRRWQNTAWFTLAMGILANIPGIAMWVLFFTTRLPEWEGVLQRLGIAFPLLWAGVMSLRLFRLSGSDDNNDALHDPH